MGRPIKVFQESGSRSRQKKVHDLLESRTLDELQLAAEMSFQSAGKSDAAKLVQQVTFSPLRASRIRQAFALKRKNILNPYSPEEALALIVSLKLTKEQYKGLRKEAKIRCLKTLYPSYDLVKIIKQKCFPKKEEITVTDNLVEVKSKHLSIIRSVYSQRFKGRF